MKLKYQLLIGVLSAIVSHKTFAQMQAGVDMPSAKAIYVQKIYPFMQTNCAQCHNEKAIDPAGPVHSNTDPNLAFPVFAKYINWNNPAASRIVKAVQTRHFCTDYNYNCKDSQRIADQMTALVISYVQQMQASTPTLPAVSDEASNVSAGPINKKSSSSQAQEVSVIAKVVETDSQSLSPSDTFQLTWNLKNVRSQPGTLLVSAVMSRYQGNFYRLQSLSVSSNKGAIYEVQGASIMINGQPVTAQTGFETIDRTLYFPRASVVSVGEESQLLSTEQPIIELNLKDRISFRFNKFVEAKSFPTRLCKSDEMFKKANAVLALTQSVLVANADKKEMCYFMESQVDIQEPRRSVLLGKDSTSQDQFLLKAIREWIDAAQLSTPTSGELGN